MKGLKPARSYLLCFVAVALLLVLTSFNASAKTYYIKVTDEAFEPDNITIEVGDTVVWKVKSSNAHTMEGGDDVGGSCAEDINHTFMANGETFSHTFTIAKPCYYTCKLHGAGMNGVIHVNEKADKSTTSTTIK